MTPTQGGSVTYQEPMVRRNGHRIYVRDHPGEGNTILLMHGFPDNLHLYDRLVPNLTPTRRVVTFDFLGWGESDKPVSYRPTARNQLHEVETVIDELGLEDPSLSPTTPPARLGSTGRCSTPIAWGRSCCSTRTTNGRRASDDPERSRCTPHPW